MISKYAVKSCPSRYISSISTASFIAITSTVSTCSTEVEEEDIELSPPALPLGSEQAERAKVIAEAEGKAKAIELVNKAAPNAAYITLEGYEALKVMADGNATKIVVPSEIQNITGLFTSLSEVVKTETPKSKAAMSKDIVLTKTATKKK